MGEDQKSDVGILEKLAMITDATQTLFPDGRCLILFELELDDYKEVQNHFRKIDKNHKKFTIDISGVEVVFILKGFIDENKSVEEPPKKTPVWKKLINSFRIRSKSPI